MKLRVKLSGVSDLKDLTTLYNVMEYPIALTRNVDIQISQRQ